MKFKTASLGTFILLILVCIGLTVIYQNESNPSTRTLKNITIEEQIESVQKQKSLTGRIFSKIKNEVGKYDSKRLRLEKEKRAKDEKEIFNMINNIRKSNQLNELVWNQNLSDASGEHLDHMIDNGYYCHVSPDGTTTVEDFDVKHGVYLSVAENLGGYAYDKSKVVSDWMGSPGHRYNILYYGHIEGAVAIRKVTSGNYIGVNYVSFNVVGKGNWTYSSYIEGFEQGLSCLEVADKLNREVF